MKNENQFEDMFYCEGSVILKFRINISMDAKNLTIKFQMLSQEPGQTSFNKTKSHPAFDREVMQDLLESVNAFITDNFNASYHEFLTQSVKKKISNRYYLNQQELEAGK